MIEIETDCIKGVIILPFIFFIFISIHICAIFSSLFHILPLAYAFYDIFTTMYTIVSINILIFVELAIHWSIKINGHNKQTIIHLSFILLLFVFDGVNAYSAYIDMHIM